MRPAEATDEALVQLIGEMLGKPVPQAQVHVHEPGMSCPSSLGCFVISRWLNEELIRDPNIKAPKVKEEGLLNLPKP